MPTLTVALYLFVGLFIFLKSVLLSGDEIVTWVSFDVVKIFAIGTMKEFWESTKETFGVFLVFVAVTGCWMVFRIRSSSTFNFLLESNFQGFIIICVFVFFFVFVAYLFISYEFGMIKGNLEKENTRALTDISTIVAIMSFIYFFFNPSSWVSWIWLASNIIPIFAIGKIGKKGWSLSKFSSVTRSIAVASCCCLIASASLNVVLPVSLIYDEEFFSFVDGMNEGNYCSYMAKYAVTSAILNASYICWILYENETWANNPSEKLEMVYESTASVFRWSRIARSAYNKCEAYLNRSWLMQKDLTLGLEFRIFNLDMLEADACFVKVYAESLYYHNAFLLNELKSHKNSTQSILTKMQELVEESSLFVQAIFMWNFREQKRQEMKLLDEMYKEASKALE